MGRARTDEVTIGTLSARTGVNIETVRYYERIGLVPPPPRSAGGRRLYGASHIAKLRFVKSARGLGFTLDEVRRLLELADGGGGLCPDVQAVALDHLARVRSKIDDLRRMEATLVEITRQCGDGAMTECPLIDALSSQEPR